MLVVSHPCVTAVNQDLYASVAEQTGWEVTIVTPNRWKNEYGEQAVTRSPRFAGQLRALRIALPGNIPLHAYVSDLSRCVREVRPDFAYIHHEPYAAATAQWAAALGHVPFAVYSAQNLAKRFPPPFAQTERFVLERASMVLPVSRAVADVVLAKGFTGDIDVQPLAVDASRFYPAEDRPLVPTVGYVGRLADEKGVDVLLHAVASSASPEWRCRIAGSGPAEDRLKSLASEIGVHERIEWLGYVDHADVADFYRSLTVLAVPSLSVPGWTEQFGRVAVEALACAVPVVASDSGELPALLRSTGAGRIVPEGDHVALACALDEALLTPALSDEARDVAPCVQEAFGESRAAARLIAAAERSTRPRPGHVTSAA